MWTNSTPPHLFPHQVKDCLSDPLAQSVTSDLGALPILIDVITHPCENLPYTVRARAMDALAAVCKHRPSLTMEILDRPLLLKHLLRFVSDLRDLMRAVADIGGAMTHASAPRRRAAVGDEGGSTGSQALRQTVWEESTSTIHAGERTLALLCTLLRSTWAAHDALESFHSPLGALAVESRRALHSMHTKPDREDETVSVSCTRSRDRPTPPPHPVPLGQEWEERTLEVEAVVVMTMDCLCALAVSATASQVRRTSTSTTQGSAEPSGPRR